MRQQTFEVPDVICLHSEKECREEETRKTHLELSRVCCSKFVENVYYQNVQNCLNQNRVRLFLDVHFFDDFIEIVSHEYGRKYQNHRPDIEREEAFSGTIRFTQI